MDKLTILGTILNALGGVAIVFSAIAAWLGKRYLDKRLAEEKYGYDVALQQRQESSERTISVYRAQFELEFRAYQELWAASATMTNEVARFPALYDSVEMPKGKGIKRDYADKARDAAELMMATALRYEPFIPQELWNAITDHGVACRQEIDLFYDALDSQSKPNTSFDVRLASKESHAATQRLLARYREINDRVRDRMATLSVKDK